MKRVIITLTGVALTFFASVCSAQSTMPPSGDKAKNKLIQAALDRNTELLANQRLAATMRVPAQETQYYWNADEETWVPVAQFNYTYNNQGLWQTVTERSLIMNAETDRIIDIEYDAQGRETHSIKQTMNDDWENESRIRHEYDAQTGELKLQTEDEWVNNGWQLKDGMRYTNTTGTGNRTEQSLTEEYVQGTGWVNSERIVYTFSGNSTNPVSSTSYDWENGAWVETGRMSEIVFENGQLVSFVEEAYDEEEDEWVKMKYTITHSTDTENQTSSMIISQAIQEGEEWISFARSTITNLTSGETYLGPQIMTEMKTEFSLGGMWFMVGHMYGEITRDDNGNITEIIGKNYDMESDEYVNLGRFVYSDFSTINTTSAEKELLANALQLYPNPTQDKLKIALDASKVQEASLRIQNLTGQTVYELASVRGEAVVDLSQLPNGVYMVRVTGANNAGITKKIVKQ